MNCYRVVLETQPGGRFSSRLVLNLQAVSAVVAMAAAELSNPGFRAFSVAKVCL
jgi:hypothetical protein